MRGGLEKEGDNERGRRRVMMMRGGLEKEGDDERRTGEGG